MKVKIIPEKFLENAQSEENLLDLSKLESIYEIRRLKVAIKYAHQVVEIDEAKETNKDGQIFIKEYEIWINKNEYMQIE